MQHRAFTLLLTWISSAWRRLRYDWIRELVVFLCGGIFVGLALYVAHDFLHVELKQIHSDVVTRMRMFASLVLWLAVWLVSTSAIANEVHSEASLSATAYRIGERPSTLRFFQLMRAALVVALGQALFIWISDRLLYSWDTKELGFLFGFGVLFAFAYGFLLRKRSQSGFNRARDVSQQSFLR